MKELNKLSTRNDEPKLIQRHELCINSLLERSEIRHPDKYLYIIEPLQNAMSEDVNWDEKVEEILKMMNIDENGFKRVKGPPKFMK